jgi:chromosome segregation ATPase
LTNELTQIESEIAKVESRRNELFRLKEPIDEELSSSYESLSDLKNRRDSLLTAEKENDWNWLLQSGYNQSTTKYNLCEKKLAEIGLRQNGYWEKTGQTAVQVYLTKNDLESYNKTVAGLQTILPHIQPFEAELEYGKTDEVKMITIFEHTLCRHGSYELAISDNKIYLCHNRRIGQTFGSLEEAVKYVQRHHWYDGGDEEEDG